MPVNSSIRRTPGLPLATPVAPDSTLSRRSRSGAKSSILTGVPGPKHRSSQYDGILLPFPDVHAMFSIPQKPRQRGGKRASMEMEITPTPEKKRRLTVFGKRARQKRIFARLREGWAYDEIAREERLTAARVRQIVSEVLQKRQVDDSMAHALLQLSRLGPAVQLAGEAVAGARSTRSGRCSGRSTGSTATRRTPASFTATTRKSVKNCSTRSIVWPRRAAKNTAPVRSRSRSRSWKKWNPRPRRRRLHPRPRPRLRSVAGQTRTTAASPRNRLGRRPSVSAPGCPGTRDRLGGGGEAPRPIRRKPLKWLDPEKEMQGHANVADAFWAAWSAHRAGAARSCKELSNGRARPWRAPATSRRSASCTTTGGAPCRSCP